MVLDATSSLGAMTGARYIESLKDGREVWLDGEKVQDVTTHPALSGIAHELARIYDLQASDEFRDQMTFVSPETGNRCSLSWLLPRSLPYHETGVLGAQREILSFFHQTSAPLRGAPSPSS